MSSTEAASTLSKAIQGLTRDVTYEIRVLATSGGETSDPVTETATTSKILFASTRNLCILRCETAWHSLCLICYLEE